jgi:hypothetical protein
LNLTMTLLNQIVAIEKGVKNASERAFTDAHRKSQQLAPITGIARTYQPRKEDGDELPPERTLVQYTVEEVNGEVVKALTRLFDVTATKDYANTEAKADVVVDGLTLVEGAPVPYLLFLEKRLADLRTYVNKLPTLDPAEEWEQDATTGAYRTKPSKKARTQKVPQNHELAPATDKHPAQVQVFTIDEVVGDWTTVKFSGAITEVRRRELLERVEKLVTAVQYAREKANTHEVSDVNVGAEVLGFIFA